ncbi:connector enhancer of kinase suppressor of ras 2-like isoform X2 [Acipenser ruthenus]|uniref:connector enhancer of kinase suppressor of ras 2-like isoform X2 n=1 Tax=Acipenser ruthenus TaxID=7906 RepID=UPI002740ADC3|nr:connector enhancer of kinase suppressor of ras 2-like isoform X2 [Acipenser ruthenus]
MEPIATWSHESVIRWLRGLEPALQQYHFEEWQLTGEYLLRLSYQDLERLGIRKIGHQELILEAVELLCSLNYDVRRENMRSVTEKLRGVSHTLQGVIQSRWKVNTYKGTSVSKLAPDILLSIIDLVTAAKALFSWLNRYLFSHLNDYSATKDIVTLCTQLGNTVKKDSTAYEKEKEVVSICKQLVDICDSILKNSSESLLNHTANLESVGLIPVAPGENLGIEITSTGSSLHFVTGTAAQSPAGFCEQILPGDEVIQVNDQVVVGWSRQNLIKKLRENPEGVTLVLKKVPISLVRQEKATKPPDSQVQVPGGPESPTVFNRVTASIRSLSQLSKNKGENSEEKSLGGGSEVSEAGGDSGYSLSQSTWYDSDQEGELLSKGDQTPPSLTTPESPVREGSVHSPGISPESAGAPSDPSFLPGTLELKRYSWQRRHSFEQQGSDSEMAAQTHEERASRKSNTKGVRSTASRRRISCRELGKADCEGWLWNKKNESSVFVTQKWQRFWFVLKGPSLYWYNSQHEEKAEGFINVSSYNIESAGDHKRKYVFKVCHERFRTFFFAADNVTDMSKWINCLIAAILKHKQYSKNFPKKEEDCYSETEPEDEDSNSPRAPRHKAYTKRQSDGVQTISKGKKGKEARNKENIPQSGGATSTAEKTQTGVKDDMDNLYDRIKEGGVSLIGSQQLSTMDHFRKSFIKRNKNPVINEKALRLRALKSTLKAKEAELHVINAILDDPELTSQKFKEWKVKNEDLCNEIAKLTKAKTLFQGDQPASLCSSESGMDEELPSPATDSELRVPEVDSLAGYRIERGELLVDDQPPSPGLECSPQAMISEAKPRDSLERTAHGNATVSSNHATTNEEPVVSAH